MAMQIVDHNDHFRIYWDYRPRDQEKFLKAVKNIGERRPYTYTINGKIVTGYNVVQKSRFVADAQKGSKYWSVPSQYRDQVMLLQETCNASLVDPQAMKPEIVGVLPIMPELRVKIPLKMEMRHYQQLGVQQLIDWRGGINGDDMGLGKSCQSIAVTVALNSFPCICVVPASLKLNWLSEWNIWTDKKVVVLDDNTVKNWPQLLSSGTADVLITNFESLKKFFVVKMPPKTWDKKLGHSSNIEMRPEISMFKSIIVDEAHRCKNPETRNSKLTMRMAQGRELRLVLTGTIIVNSPKDAWPQLCIAGKHHVFGSEKQFLDRYCEGGNGTNNLRELKYKLHSRCMIRREKSEVLKELPDKIRQTIICDIDTRDEYNRVLSDFKKYLESVGYSDREVAKSLRGEVMVKMGVLKQISARGKLKAVQDWVEDILESGKKVILFANLHEIIDQVHAMFPSFVKITGKQDVYQKQAAANAFQTDPKVQGIIGNIKAMGVGFNLTAGSYVGFIEYPYHPADCKQCEDRAYRIGTKDTVFATYFLGRKTIDERSFAIIKHKMSIVNEAIGSADNMETELINALLNDLRS